MFGYKPSTKVWRQFNFLLCYPELHYANLETLCAWLNHAQFENND